MNDGSDKKPQQVFNSEGAPLRVDLPRGILASPKRDDIIILGCIDDEGNAIPLRTEGGMVSLRAISQKWEYEMLSIHNSLTTDATKRELNAYGDDGWEVCGGAMPGKSHLGFLLKRPKAEAKS